MGDLERLYRIETYVRYDYFQGMDNNLREDDFRWLIRQAERVGELEEENRQLNQKIGKWSNDVRELTDDCYDIKRKSGDLFYRMIEAE